MLTSLEYKEKAPAAEEFEKLRQSTGWPALSRTSIENALRNSLFSVSVYHNNSIVAMGRVIGDDAIYFYIQDVIVLPGYKRKGIGRKIMQRLIQYVEGRSQQNSFLGLMSAQGVKTFYTGLGFLEREHDAPGMFKIINKSE